MSCEVRTTDNFEKEFKRLNKKFPSLKNEFYQLEEELRINPKLGIAIGRSCYKIRIAVKSKGKGKSGGARVITYYISAQKKEVVHLLSIYDKSELENITDEDLNRLTEEIKF